MEKQNLKYKGQDLELIIHSIDDEVSEVYVYWRDEEIIFAYDLDDAKEKIEQFFRNV